MYNVQLEIFNGLNILLSQSHLVAIKKQQQQEIKPCSEIPPITITNFTALMTSQVSKLRF